MVRRLLLFLFGAALLFSGNLAIAESLNLGINTVVEIGTNFISFGQFPNGVPYTPAPGFGTFQVSLVNSSVFSSAGVVTGEFGMIQSLNQTLEPGGPAGFTPIEFMTFDMGGSNLQLWADNIPFGNVSGWPFTFIDTPIGAVASFNVDGFIKDTTTGNTVDTFTGICSATFAGVSTAQLLASLPV